jgi:hypothetical protein
MTSRFLDFLCRFRGEDTFLQSAIDRLLLYRALGTRSTGRAGPAIDDSELFEQDGSPEPGIDIEPEQNSTPEKVN